MIQAVRQSRFRYIKQQNYLALLVQNPEISVTFRYQPKEILTHLDNEAAPA